MPVLCWASGSGCMAKLLKILCRLSPCPDPFLRQRPRVPAGVPPADRYQAPLTVQRTFPPSADLPRRLSSWKRLFRSPKPGEDVLPERRRRRASPLDSLPASEDLASMRSTALSAMARPPTPSLYSSRRQLSSGAPQCLASSSPVPRLASA
jgi:hypothetical protein